MYNINIDNTNDSIIFEWDQNKNEKGIKKHGVSFEEAATVFCDEYAIIFDDPDHSADENRFLIIGISDISRMCVVSHCYRVDDSVIRIISARLATRKETETYNKQFL